jgi:hypothetical protein
LSDNYNLKVKLDQDEIDVIIDALACYRDLKVKNKHVGAAALHEFFNTQKTKATPQPETPSSEKDMRCGPNHCKRCD